jgi:hypothetical protein
VIRISLPAGSPTWLISLWFAGVALIGLLLGLVRLVRAALPGAAERLDWWKYFWAHRRQLRRERWIRREQRRDRRHARRSSESNQRRRVVREDIVELAGSLDHPPRRESDMLGDALPGRGHDDQKQPAIDAAGHLLADEPHRVGTDPSRMSGNRSTLQG